MYDRTRLTQYVCIFASISMVLWHCIEMKMYYRPRPDTVQEQISIVTMPSSAVSRKSCKLIPDPGPCRASIDMYYFDPAKGECAMFKWGGCQGNGNRFDSEIECLNSCLKSASETSRPRWCSLSFDYGFCFGAVPRYYYDNMWKVCKERIYSGCGGNQNNFYSFEQCESVCRFGKGKIPGVIKSVTGPKKVLIKNPDGATTKRGIHQGHRSASILRTEGNQTLNITQ